MYQKDKLKDEKDKKSIDELEAEVTKLNQKVVQQTQSVKKILQTAVKGELNPPIMEFSSSITGSGVETHSIEQAQAEFFASIATLDTIISNYQGGKIDSQTYNEQLKLLISDIFKFKILLEKKGYNISDFIREENIKTLGILT
jgi:SMC interacting uncharacterized protein involved in chromosome segregation